MVFIFNINKKKVVSNESVEVAFAGQIAPEVVCGTDTTKTTATTENVSEIYCTPLVNKLIFTPRGKIIKARQDTKHDNTKRFELLSIKLKEVYAKWAIRSPVQFPSILMVIMELKYQTGVRV